MASSTLIVDYIQFGLAANRPATPNIPTGACAIYYATDTTTGYLWQGSSWVTIISTGTTPSIVQNAAEATTVSGSVTMGSAPTNGNLLIAFCDNNAGVTAASGWTVLGTTNSAGTDFAGIFWKVAGASESTTQTPITQTSAGAIMIYELASAAPSIVEITDSNSAGTNFNTEATRSGGLLIGALCNQSGTQLPTGITGATADNTANTSSRSIAGFHQANVSAGAVNVAWTYGASHDIKQFGLVVY